MNLLEEIILTLSKIPEEELNNETLHKVKKEITRKYRVNSLPTNIQLQKKYNQLVNQ
jgi:histone acetyltransferase (RNA polymerase elongator complex component)